MRNVYVLYALRITPYVCSLSCYNLAPELRILVQECCLF